MELIWRPTTSEPVKPDFSFLDWFFTLIDNHFALIILLLILAVSKKLRKGISDLLNRILSADRFKFGNIEWKMSSEQYAEFTQNYSQHLKTELKSIFEPLVQTNKLVTAFSDLVETVVKPLLDSEIVKDPDQQLRCTIHVVSPDNPENVYQLLEYYPKSDPAEEKRGRIKSIRFGIIGRALRGKQTAYNGDVEPSNLVSDWGMTRSEANEAGKGNSTFLAVPITNELDEAVGCLFVDVKPPFAFGESMDREQLDDKIRVQQQWAAVSNLVSDIQMQSRQSWKDRQAQIRNGR